MYNGNSLLGKIISAEQMRYYNFRPLTLTSSWPLSLMTNSGLSLSRIAVAELMWIRRAAIRHINIICKCHWYASSDDRLRQCSCLQSIDIRSYLVKTVGNSGARVSLRCPNVTLRLHTGRYHLPSSTVIDNHGRLRYTSEHYGIATVTGK